MSATGFNSDAEAMRALMDAIPIYATKIGYRTDSTEAETALAAALFKVHQTWLEVKPA